MANPLAMPRPRYQHVTQRHRASPEEKKRSEFLKVGQRIINEYPPPDNVSLCSRCCRTVYGYACNMVADVTSADRGVFAQPVTALFFGGFVYGATCLALKLALPELDNFTLLSYPIISGGITSIAALIGIRFVSSDLHSMAMRWCYDHGLSQIEGTKWLSVLKNHHGKQLAESYIAKAFKINDPSNLNKNANLEDLSDEIAEFIEGVANKCNRWSRMSPGQQKEFVSQALQEELKQSAIQCSYHACQHSHEGQLYHKLLNKMHQNYDESENYKGNEELQITRSALMELIKKNHLAFWLVEFIKKFMYGVPSSSILINIIYYEVVRPTLDNATVQEKERTKTRYSDATRTMHNAVLNYLTEKQNSGQSSSTQIPCLESPVSPSTVSAQKAPAQPVKSKKKRRTRDTGIHTVQEVYKKPVGLLPDAAKSSITGLCDHTGRSKFINKCIERIENCDSWNDLKMLQSCDGKLSATMLGTGKKNLPVYHKSAGVRDNQSNRKATVFFTCVDNKVVPIALAEHVGQGSAEYRVIKCCEGWNIPKKRICLNEPMLMQKSE
ncbi:hypothetical protein [Parendozoicomonas sp. Alg238-R29]|uniref:hypothetical protein n=1 Tax=Parendozoicomonas sp. Alg238-R29 TaxID=2993446 RepID=UPI00248DB199|nr:hypothetical protein [Parendozoicomonas sp. Alg238-R29]